MREVHCSRFNLASFYDPLIKGDKLCLCVSATKGKIMGFINIALSYFVYIMSLLSMNYYNLLNTLDACWIAVDRWSNSNRCTQESAYLLMNVMPIYT